MLPILHHVESILPYLLMDEEGWESKRIDYTPPFVDRLYRDVEINGVPHRVYLHRIYPCERAFFHPHPWPSAIRVLGTIGSTYEMGIGFGASDRHDPPPVAATLRSAGSLRYEMTHPDGWHYVRVTGVPSTSVMVSGPVWERPGGAPRTASRAFLPLTEEERKFLLNRIRAAY